MTHPTLREAIEAAKADLRKFDHQVATMHIERRAAEVLVTAAVECDQLRADLTTATARAEAAEEAARKYAQRQLEAVELCQQALLQRDVATARAEMAEADRDYLRELLHMLPEYLDYWQGIGDDIPLSLEEWWSVRGEDGP